MVQRVGELAGSTTAMRGDIAEMKPMTDHVQRWKRMGIGALTVIGIGGTVLG
ncbi:hypothetical protein J2Z31_002760 [Sinorhizobium kostiense]|uniref:Uncharacterized protein n=2 Tax=Sinorhizobium/Ensifer group TaxID=227292 RepID=A0ABS4R1I2_9HYPH|nr:hypothetical protein [Sinorhizobium kostiense]